MRRLLLLCLLAAGATGDAIVTTRAMTAPTIVELFIDADGLRAELEIGLQDLEAFGNLFPDELREKLGLPAAPIAERFATFFQSEWVVRADDRLLVPRVDGMTGRARIRRDEITGEPIGEEEATVLHVELFYSFAASATPPRTLAIRPPPGASIGFVTYHAGVAINDFRYLGAEAVVDLDWNDPWYSRFRNRNLWRRYDAPLNLFLYVDFQEVRKEIIVRPRDLQHWVDLGLGDAKTIPAAAQAEIKRKAADFLGRHGRVTIDGAEAEFTLDRIHFVRRTLKRTGVVDPPEDLPADSATLGVIFVHPRAGDLPKKVTVHWDLFSPRIQSVPAVATDEAGGLPAAVTPDDPDLVWQNFLTNPRRPALADLALPPLPGGGVPLASIVCVLAALVRRRWLWSGAFVVAAVLLFPYARVGGSPGTIGREESERVLDGLLHNVYRAFDFRGEGPIYDTLERSVDGDLLSDIYLETRRALELENQGGARAKVKEVKIVDVATSSLGHETGFAAECTWDVAGAVGHWGHIHTRRNRYRARLTVKPVDGAWKITRLELLDERRL